MSTHPQATLRLRSSFGVVVIGTGALGSAVCEQLGRSRFRRVLLIDPDRVADRNLLRSSVLREAARHDLVADAPPFKAPLLATAMLRRFGLAWESLVCEIADAGLGKLSNYDVLCCCTDSALSRAETAWAARQLGLPMLDCGIFGDGIEEGRVTWFGADIETPCYLCGLSEQRRADLLASAVSASLGCSPPSPEVSMTGTASAAGYTASEAVALLNNATGQQKRDSIAWRLRKEDAGTWAKEALRLARSTTCPLHELPDPRVYLHWEVPLKSSLGRYPGMLLQLDWPICTAAACRVCGTTASPMRRVSWVRRMLPCPECGTQGTMENINTVCAIGPDDALARCSPRQLNQPAEQTYILRRRLTPPATQRSHVEPSA